MKKVLVKCRNWFIGTLYRLVLKPILFLFDPEDIHDLFTSTGQILGRYSFTRFLTRLSFGYHHHALEQDLVGIKFKNPIGLAAGFDKDARLIDIMPAVGFGFEEIGSITGEPCAGNPRPRLWRLPKSQSLAVWYGLKNLGSAVISQSLSSKVFPLPVGVSVAMTNCQANLDLNSAVEDYTKAFTAFSQIGAYTTVNISCPNAKGGQPFNNPENLEKLLTRLDQIATSKPVLLKMSPDLSEEDLDKIIVVARRHRVRGFICSNLTKKLDNDLVVDQISANKGGMSGKVSRPLALGQINHIYRQTRGEMVIIGCGGVFNAHDAYEMIRAGSSLIQLITGMIFEGPQVISSINLGLVELLQRDGFSSVREAVGVDNLTI